MSTRMAHLEERLRIKTTGTGQKVREPWVIGGPQHCIEKCIGSYTKTAPMRRIGLPLLDRLGMCKKEKRAKMYVELGDIFLISGVISKYNYLEDKANGQYRKALHYYEKAIALGVENADVYYHCGLIYARLNRYKSSIIEAIKYYNKSIKLSETAEAYNNRGCARIKHADYCLKESEKAKYNGETDKAGKLVEEAQKEMQKAINDFGKAREICPKCAEPSHNSRLASEKAGKISHVRYLH
ncbi:Photosystem I assembly protein Ycf3 [uncultured archaeon]|nr:Photosystem I assembly protein Ycf3 [uncultured archaeon]